MKDEKQAKANGESRKKMRKGWNIYRVRTIKQAKRRIAIRKMLVLASIFLIGFAAGTVTYIVVTALTRVLTL